MATAIATFRNRILVEVPGCPIPRIDLQISDSIRQLCEDTYAYHKSFEVEDIDYSTEIDSSDNDAITIDLSSYISNVDPVAPLKFQIDGGDWILSKLTLENDNSNLTNIEIQGVKFFNFPTTSSIKIFPFTDQQANFDVFLKLAVKPTRDLTSYEDVFYNDDNFFKAIIHHSAYELQRMPKRPWTDYEKSSDNKAKYDHFMGMAKIDESLGHSYGDKAVSGGYF